MQQAKTNEQFRAFQHEIEFCEKEIRRFEDRILEFMAESEPLDANVKKADAALKQEQQQVEAETSKARERTAADQRELERLRSERVAAVAALPKQSYAAYERIRKKWNGIVIAEAAGGRCTACQIAMRPQFFQDLKKAETMMFCESCGRILFYNPPVSFEQHLAAQPGPHV
jgi:predicted  nucleic acid-binding Zn-ribbon protein